MVWLKVPRKLLVELGIADRISRYSYERGEYVYLEEDRDCGTFMTNWQNRTDKLLWEHTRTHTADRESRIRGYDSYVNRTAAEREDDEVLRRRMLKAKNWNHKAQRTIRTAGHNLLNQWAGQFDLAPS